MIARALTAALAALVLSGPTAAQDFSENSEARSWNLFAEQPARFEATVVDILCEVTGTCAGNPPCVRPWMPSPRSSVTWHRSCAAPR